ncbi:hypothetical protein EF902_17465 [Streptomyces sp. WAC05858]|nr:hypothetical protein EF902_17465 [Streptomyces sp. WAC05858]
MGLGYSSLLVKCPAQRAESHGNAVLRRHIPGRVRYEPADRLWFASLSSLIPRRRWAKVADTPEAAANTQTRLSTARAAAHQTDGRFSPSWT